MNTEQNDAPEEEVDFWGLFKTAMESSEMAQTGAPGPVKDSIPESHLGGSVEKIGGKFRCQECGKICKGYPSAETHVFQRHRGGFKCSEPSCTYSVRDRRMLHIHKMKVHNTPIPKEIEKKLTKCRICGEPVGYPSLMQRHLRTCHGICEPQFGETNSSSGPESSASLPNKCPICTFAAASEEPLMAHMATVHSEQIGEALKVLGLAEAADSAQQ